MRKTMRTIKMGERCPSAASHWSSSIAEQLDQAFWRTWPQECCGVVGRRRDGRLVFESLSNEAAVKERAFEVSPADVLRLFREAEAREETPVAWIHSHPSGEGHCSQMDRDGFWVGEHWLWPGMEHGILWLDAENRLHLSVVGPQKRSNEPKVNYSGVLTPISV
tara:strand:- start:341 stop:832 length:492 start_codon:yes stop_codon:yes gene_type:complete